MSTETPENIDRRQVLGTLAVVGAGMLGVSCSSAPRGVAEASQQDRLLREKIKTIVVIYAENRSFHNLFANFPGLAPLPADAGLPQRDRDGSVLATLPPIWGGLVPTAQHINGKRYLITQDKFASLPNRPFPLSDSDSQPLPLDVITRDLSHRFYQNQMQINGGRCDQFVAWGDGGALVMGHYAQAADEMKLAAVARRYTMCDRFFMAAFGGSWLNHIYLISAQAPFYPNAANSHAKHLLSRVEGDEPQGQRLKLAANSPASAMTGPPKFERDGSLTPDGYGINTMAPPFQPSYVRPAPDGDPRFADPSNAHVMPAQTNATIGDRLSDKGVSWAWYAGAWSAALQRKGEGPTPNFQFHHQPFNYFANFAPGTAARDLHLKDAGLGDEALTNHFLTDVKAGCLPSVSFYKPQGNLNMHAGYTDIVSGDRHLTKVIEQLEQSPQWPGMLVIVTVDENGGWWDPIAPPQGDRWGPGSRVPAIVISPHAKKGHVDHTPYDSTSILRLISRVHGLAPLPGVQQRDQAMRARGQPELGDLTASLAI